MKKTFINIKKVSIPVHYPAKQSTESNVQVHTAQHLY